MFNGSSDLIGVKGFLDKFDGAVLDGFYHFFFLAGSRDHNDIRLTVELHDLFQSSKTIEDRHSDIHSNNIWIKLDKFFVAFLPVVRLADNLVSGIQRHTGRLRSL